MPNANDVASTTITLTTNNATGYTLNASDSSAAYGMTCACGTVPDWTGTVATPIVWPAGTTGYFGLTVRDATGGRLAKWGIGTGTAPNDYVNNYYAGLNTTSDTLHTRFTFSASSDTVLTTYRINLPDPQPAGAYSNVVSYTAVANP